MGVGEDGAGASTANAEGGGALQAGGVRVVGVAAGESPADMQGGDRHQTSGDENVGVGLPADGADKPDGTAEDDRSLVGVGAGGDVHMREGAAEDDNGAHAEESQAMAGASASALQPGSGGGEGGGSGVPGGEEDKDNAGPAAKGQSVPRRGRSPKILTQNVSC